MAIRNVVSTLDANGAEMMGPGILLYHINDPSIMDGSLITVESNHFCVLKSRGAILNVYETGQYQVQTPDRVLFGSIQKAFYGGQSPWQYEVIYINRAKSVIRSKGVALSRELAELSYEVDYYVHVDTVQDAVKLVQHMPYQGHGLTGDQLNNYAGPVVEQAINQIIQLTPLEQVNERIGDITDLVRRHLQEFLAVYGVLLNDVKVLVAPRDERMKDLISLKAFGLSEHEAVRAYLALKMADQGLITAANALVGAPFEVGIVAPSSLPVVGLNGAK